MSVIGLNPFYNGEPLESGEPVEGVEISHKYKYDYVEGLIYIIEIHKWNDGNVFTHNKGYIEINRITEEQNKKLLNSGNASEF